MLRFLPDGWFEGLLRPFILADPLAGIYFEEAAPDWRFAACIVFMALALAAGRARARLQPPQARTFIGLLGLFYIWTFVSGNGRYFIPGLLVIGPLLVLACRLLPGTRALRVSALALVVALQALGLQSFYTPNSWGMVPWRQGPGLPIEASPLREKPAVFLTITFISYSLLVPKFHPQSRWANIAGQRNIVPGVKEWARLRALLATDLPKYVLAPLAPQLMSADLQPVDEMRRLYERSLAPHGLALAGRCEVLRSDLAAPAPGSARSVSSGGSSDARPERGFWVCPVANAGPGAAPAPDAGLERAAQLDDVFGLVEQRCPRFFPPGDGKTQTLDHAVLRHYPASDVRIYIADGGQVYYRYFRALLPTPIGTVEQIRGGRFTLDCDKLPGRYRLPWQRD